jgi:hypothetical protein
VYENVGGFDVAMDDRAFALVKLLQRRETRVEKLQSLLGRGDFLVVLILDRAEREAIKEKTRNRSRCR